MINQILRIGRDLFELLYPVSCLVCGDRLSDQSHLCSFCMDYAFQPSNQEGRESCEGIILPDWITMQDALWEFDKGGFLQDVLHHVKYSGLAELGIVLGKRMGRKLKDNKYIRVSESSVLLPVPLHSKRQRKRGYNQSALIAEGISKVTGAVMADRGEVIRTRNTRTQTGLNAESRRKNLAEAFCLGNTDFFRGKTVVIVDDVITTGATAFELASKVRPFCGPIGVATIARA